MAERVVYPAPMPLGPGDSAREVPRVFHQAPAALGPGDSTREKPEPKPAPQAVGPGDGPEPDFIVVAPPAFGPGDVQVPRPVRRVAVKRQTVAPRDAAEERE